MTARECCPPPTRSAGDCATPQVEFGWGRNHTVTGYVTGVAVRCSMFDAQGTPVRANCTLTIHAPPAPRRRRDRPLREPAQGAAPLGGAAASLASIADRVFGRPRRTQP